MSNRLFDKALVQRAVQGDERAWRQIIALYGKSIETAIRIKILSINKSFLQDLGDIYNQVFLSLKNHKLKLYLDGNYTISLKYFLSIIAKSATIDYIRKESYWKSENTQKALENSNIDSYLEPAAFNKITNKETINQIYQVLNSINQEKRKIFEQYMLGEKQKEIGSKFGLNEKQVNKVIFNLKMIIKKKVEL